MTGYRKLILTGAAVLVLILVELLGGRLTSESQETIRWLVVAFLGANGVEWAAGAFGRRTPPTAPLWLVGALAAGLAWPAFGCGGVQVERGLEYQQANVWAHSDADETVVIANGAADMELNVGLLELLAYIQARVTHDATGPVLSLTSQLGARLQRQLTVLVEFNVDTGTEEMLLCARFGAGQDLRRLCVPLRSVREPPNQTVEGVLILPEAEP